MCIYIRLLLLENSCIDSPLKYFLNSAWPLRAKPAILSRNVTPGMRWAEAKGEAPSQNTDLELGSRLSWSLPISSQDSAPYYMTKMVVINGIQAVRAPSGWCEHLLGLG